MNEKILVRGVNWIGDAVMTLPALRSLRKAFPESRLSLLVKPSVAPIFEKNPFIDEVILYEEKGIIGKLRLARRLKRDRFSRAILLQNAFDAALISFLAGIPERSGYDRDSRGTFLTRRIPYNGNDRKVHHIDYYLGFLRAAGIAAEYAKPWIHLTLDERLWARNTFAHFRRPILGINPGAAYGSAKRWLPQRFAEVSNWFIRDTGGSAILFGGTNEGGVAHEIKKSLLEQNPGVGNDGSKLPGSSFLNMAGRTSLRELISMISECDVFLSNDSGPMHIAYAVGTPVVALFGSTSPELTGPVGEGSVVLHADTVCSPCFERACKNNDLQCMNDIGSDDVYLAVRKMLPGRPAVFFDRDGTLCEDVGYLNRVEDFRLLPGVEGLAALRASGFRLIGVTNQSGIARGLVDKGFTEEINKVFVERYGFDEFLYCPHLPADYCPCRKPEPGMLHDALHKRGIDLRRSFVVGDKESDMILAKTVGAKSILVTTGKQSDSPYADFVAQGLKEAMDFILGRGRAGE